MKPEEMLRVDLAKLPEPELMALMDYVSDEVKRRYVPMIKSGEIASQVKKLFESAFAPTPTGLKDPER